MSQICQACQRLPAKELTLRADGRKQWRCQTCMNRKNPPGFTFKKEKPENEK